MGKQSIHLSERNKEIFELRKSGLTYKSIGNTFGITAERVRCILMDELRRINRKKTTFSDLPIRVENDLLRKYSTKEEVYIAVFSGELSPKNNSLMMYGEKAHKAVCDWLGVYPQHQ